MIDFERLSKLAQEDPSAFIEERRQLIEAEIIRLANGDEVKLKELREFQQTIDNGRAIDGTPKKALATIVSMMADNVAALGLAFAGINEQVAKLKQLKENS